MVSRILFLLLLNSQIEAVMQSQLWKRCSVNQTAVQAASYLEKISAVYQSDIVCSMHASLIPRMSLFCVTDGVCNIWDYQSFLVSEPTFDAADDHCMLNAGGCYYTGNSQKLEEGSTVQEAGCELEFLHVCNPNGVVKPDVEATRRLTNCEAPFTSTSVGCLLVTAQTMTFPEARTLCLSYGADLFVAQSPDEFSLLSTYVISTHGTNSKYWMGVQNMSGNWQWYNGRPVHATEIKEFSNNANEFFARFEYDGSKFLLYDFACAGTFGVICLASV